MLLILVPSFDKSSFLLPANTCRSAELATTTFNTSLLFQAHMLFFHWTQKKNFEEALLYNNSGHFCHTTKKHHKGINTTILEIAQFTFFFKMEKITAISVWNETRMRKRVDYAFNPLTSTPISHEVDFVFMGIVDVLPKMTLDNHVLII